MSDETIIESETVEIEKEELVEEPQGSETDWKVESRKWEKRAKESSQFKDNSDKWNEYEQSLKPEQERLAEELNETKAEAVSAKMALLRYEVAAEKGLTAEAVKLLNGANREELEDAADSLIAIIAGQSSTKTPKVDRSQGRATGTGSTTQDQFAAAISALL
jgi:uncharacterized phage infection (PIP) family protein YhgE